MCWFLRAVARATPCTEGRCSRTNPASTPPRTSFIATKFPRLYSLEYDIVGGPALRRSEGGFVRNCVERAVSTPPSKKPGTLFMQPRASSHAQESAPARSVAEKTKCDGTASCGSAGRVLGVRACGDVARCEAAASATRSTQPGRAHSARARRSPCPDRTQSKMQSQTATRTVSGLRRCICGDAKRGRRVSRPRAATMPAGGRPRMARAKGCCETRDVTNDFPFRRT